ncbi:hypothetical protein [Brumicola nitratireducens]|jgi:hypothetical protein|uniref:Uncharacterized protein n=1 Tax=Glaciecola nitratireducens (strain JCM 12485 / KCTC 12276 / FR1064) TaxID=1085623 RepID=G4QJ80_GLANF|nr:hypothetical protein [Glaciecola nitratireducens]AEP28948.1 hypothetical protein GNIT_0804 [Glaciecola nitratireducens FR1064]|tara:strand:- start:629 stop:820 length:192 start_codon:yes stop_codon:yes gene_type:complete
MNGILSGFLFGATAVALVLGLSCIVMAFLSGKTGAEGMREKIEYGFMGFSGLAITLLLGYAAA